MSCREKRPHLPSLWLVFISEGYWRIHWFVWANILLLTHSWTRRENITSKEPKIVYECRFRSRYGEDSGAAPARGVSCPSILCSATEASRCTCLVVAPFCPCLAPGLSKKTLFYFHITSVTGRDTLCCTALVETSDEAAISSWQNLSHPLLIVLGAKGCFVNRPKSFS